MYTLCFVKVAAFEALVIENYIITASLSSRSKLCCCLNSFSSFPRRLNVYCLQQGV